MTSIDPKLVPKTGFAKLDKSNTHLAETGSLIAKLSQVKKPDCRTLKPLVERFIELGNHYIEHEKAYLKLAGNHRANWRQNYFRSVLIQLSDEIASCKGGHNALSTAMVRRLVDEWLYEHFCNSPYLDYQGDVDYPSEVTHLLQA